MLSAVWICIDCLFVLASPDAFRRTMGERAAAAYRAPPRARTLEIVKAARKVRLIPMYTPQGDGYLSSSTTSCGSCKTTVQSARWRFSKRKEEDFDLTTGDIITEINEISMTDLAMIMTNGPSTPRRLLASRERITHEAFPAEEAPTQNGAAPTWPDDMLIEPLIITAIETHDEHNSRDTDPDHTDVDELLSLTNMK